MLFDLDTDYNARLGHNGGPLLDDHNRDREPQHKQLGI